MRMADRDTYEFVSMVRGYHEYRSAWSAVVGEELQCRIELSNPHDLLVAVAVCKSDGVVTVGHVPMPRWKMMAQSLKKAHLEEAVSID